MLGIAMQPLSTATGNIGFGIAVGCALPNLPQFRAELAVLLRQGWMRLLLAWIAWTLLSMTWSPDPRFGLEQLKAIRVLLWIPVLWPLRERWRHLVGAILAGTTVMAILQATQVELGWPKAKFAVGSGLTTPTQTGLWAAVSISFWLILTVSARPMIALATLPLAMLSGVGLAWSATRASAIGLGVELVVANVVLALTSRGWLVRAAIRCLIGLAILGSAATFAGRHLQRKMTVAVASVQNSQGVTSEVRLDMWKAALQGWRQAPIAGVGAGGIPSVMRSTSVTHPKVDLRSVTMIHSTYIQALTETGVVGLSLLLGFLALLYRDALRGLRHRPMLIAGFGGLVVWTVAAAFDGYQQSGGFLTVGAILIPLALADERPRDAA